VLSKNVRWAIGRRYAHATTWGADISRSREFANAKLPTAALSIFRSLACAPSEECCLGLLTKFGLAYFTASFWPLVAECWRLAFDIFDALPPHTVAAAYSGPINATGHNALEL
jgi:hypothetical protein